MIVATNIAETSLTIPGIRYVIDTGLARISRYNPRTRTSRRSWPQRSGSGSDPPASAPGSSTAGCRIFAAGVHRQRGVVQESVAGGGLLGLHISDADIAAEGHARDLGFPARFDVGAEVLFADRGVVAERRFRAEAEGAAEGRRVIETEQAVGGRQAGDQPVHRGAGRRAEALGVEGAHRRIA